MKKTSPQRTLTGTQVSLVGLGGAIGATLFVGSGVVVANTGPAAMISYLIGGLTIIVAMRMLGEMATVQPARGSFATYAAQAIGPWAGFTLGWLYWAVWVTVIAYEISLSGFMLHDAFPAVPIWVGGTLMFVSLLIANLYSLRNFATVESALSILKVVAVVAFAIVGVLLISGVIDPVDDRDIGWSMVQGHGGFFPLGIGVIFTSVVLVVFSMTGAEIAAIAASESDDPARNVARAIKQTVFRVILFFSVSVAVIVLVIPWYETGDLANPFARVFGIAGLPAAETVMSVVVFIAIASIMNSGIYTSSRMLEALADKGDAPRVLAKRSRRDIPKFATCIVAVIAYALALLNMSSLSTLFTFLANCTGGVILLVYIFLGVSHIRLRRLRGDATLTLKVWLFPGLSYFFVAASCVMYVSQLFITGLRTQFLCTTGFLAVVLVGYWTKTRWFPSKVTTVQAMPNAAISVPTQSPDFAE